jgi:CHAT domain-containing protein
MARRWRRFWAGVAAIALLLPLSIHGLPGRAAVSVPGPSPPPVTLAQTALDALIIQSDRQFDDRQYDQAEAGYRQALEQLQAQDPNDETIPEILHNLGRLYLLTERYGNALTVLQQAQALASFPALLHNLALAQFHTGNYGAAETALLDALTEWETIRADDDLEDSDRVTLFEQQAHSYDLLQRVQVAQGKPEAALATAERGRGRALVTLLTQRQQQASDRPFTGAQIRAVARDQNTTLVIYSALGAGRRVLGNEVEVETDLFTWVVTPSGQITLRQVPLAVFWGNTRSGPASDPSPLETLVANTRQALGVNSRGLGIVPTERRVTDDLPPSNPLPLRSLHEMLIEPIADLLPTDPAALVTVVPDGPLFLVPFAALPDEAGQPLVASHTLAVTPSVQALALTAADDHPRTGQSLIVGNPVEMPSLTPDDLTEVPPLPPLPGAEREAAAIARLLNTEPLLRQQATEATVVAQMPRQSILHLATHGLLNLDSRLNEFGLPVDEDAPTAADANVVVTPGAVIVGDNVFVGGNDAAVALARERVVKFSAPGVLALAPGGGEDGWLTAAEIAELDLQADLVVLSACDTGRGRITGDGVVGLTRAFLSAGADTVIVSLWQVPDDATAALMVAFYEALAETGDKAAALQQAMVATRAQFPDPRNWSAFVLVGMAT